MRPFYLNQPNECIFPLSIQDAYKKVFTSHLDSAAISKIYISATL